MQPQANSNQQEIYAKRRKNLIIIGIIAFIILVIFAIIGFIIDAQKTATLDILVAPSFAKVEIRNKKYVSTANIRLKPGEVTAYVTAQGFETEEVILNLTKNEEAQIYLSLNPTDENADFYVNNPEEADLVQRINERLVNINANLYIKEHPIVNILPINIVEYNQQNNLWTEYRIDYGEFSNCKTNFCLKITDTTGGNYEKALDQIRNKGFNPDDYEIIYQYEPMEDLPNSTLQEIYQHYGIN